MKARLSLAVVGVGLILAAAPAFAHHSFAAEFDEKQPITLTGTLTKMEWVNPHGWIYVDVKGPDGQVKNWAIEAVAPNTLLRRGLRKEDFPIGSEIVVKGYKAKNGQPVANGRTVTFVNGRNFFLGSEGAGAPNDAADKPAPTNPY
jgi:Family of unknown function (DUF6152)